MSTPNINAGDGQPAANGNNNNADGQNANATPAKKKHTNGPVGSLNGNHTKDLQSKLLNLLNHKDGTSPLILELYDNTGKTLIDSVDASYEDSFGLETFADLIVAHAEREKCFILARVQTWDKKQPDKAYYSYYNAYHLNKILFQTEWKGEQRLIHRLIALNPLTNTDIIGDVQYFLVLTRVKGIKIVKNVSKSKEAIDGQAPSKAKETSIAVAELNTTEGVTPSSTSAPVVVVAGSINASSSNHPVIAINNVSSEAKKRINVNEDGDGEEEPEEAIDPKREEMNIATQRRVSFYMKRSLPPTIVPESETFISAPAPQPINNTMQFDKRLPATLLTTPSTSTNTTKTKRRATIVGSSADRSNANNNANARFSTHETASPFLGSAVLAEPSRSKAQQLAMRNRVKSLPSSAVSWIINGSGKVTKVPSNPSTSVRLGANSANETDTNNNNNATGNNLMTPNANGANNNVQENNTEAAPSLSDNNSTSAASTANNNNNSQSTNAIIFNKSVINPPPGVVTQFNEPVPPELIATELSPPTPKSHRRSLSLMNTQQQVRTSTSSATAPAVVNEAVEPETNNNNNNNNNLSVNGNNSVGVVEEQIKVWRRSLVEARGQVFDEKDIENHTFDAVLIGTDSEYLEASRMRGLFRENALTSQDVTLFEMKGSKKNATRSNSSRHRNVHDMNTFLMGQLMGDMRFRERNYLYQCICSPPPAIMETMSPGLQIFHRCKCYLVATVTVFLLFLLAFFILTSDIKPRY